MIPLTTFLDGGDKTAERKALLNALRRNGGERLHKLDCVKGSSVNGHA